MATTLNQRRHISSGDIDIVGIDYTPYLDVGETLTGTPTIAEVGSSDLTFGAGAVTSADVIIGDVTVKSGHGLTFGVSSQVAGTEYKIRVTVSTTASRTKVVDLILICDP